ncbi:MAG: sodium:proton antiporter [Acidobacteria bacterium]|nr:sodium:proton antiporter [Acidobacteriota bacterium]
MHSWLSILPPVIAIAVAIWRKEVILALVVGIFSAEIILASGNPLTAFVETAERCVDVFQSAGDTRVLLFGLLVGALLELIRASGGVSAFVQRLTQSGLTKSRRQVSWLASIIGMLIFVETSMSCLAAGVVSQPLFDRFKMSRARLAYLVDSTCAPVSVLVLLNGWGAYILSLIEPQLEGQAVAIMVQSIPLNFYALLTLAAVAYTATTTRVHGPMKQAELTLNIAGSESVEAPTQSRFMIVPMIVLVGGMLSFMFLTGDSEATGILARITSGSGSRSVLWAVFLATVTAIVLLKVHGRFKYPEMVQLSMKGMGHLLPVVIIMLLSFAIGAACKELQTGPYVAGMVGDFLPAFLVAPLLFIAAGFISFTTGTSWGTFAILIPVGLPLAASMGLPPAFVLASVLGGGVFGDHCSPISDTTIISSLASGCDHLEHVKTQLPYALTVGVVSVALYALVGLAL